MALLVRSSRAYAGPCCAPRIRRQPAVQARRLHAHARTAAQAASELRKLATRTAGAVGAAAQSGVARQQMGELLHYASGAGRARGCCACCQAHVSG